MIIQTPSNKAHPKKATPIIMGAIQITEATIIMDNMKLVLPVVDPESLKM
jgi:hypothetical protein